jgi:hypothetical protein
MRRRKLLAVLAGLAVLAVGAFVLWPRPIVPGVTPENFDRIQIGMTCAEVEALLGQPEHRSILHGMSRSPAERVNWSNADAETLCLVQVIFDSSGHTLDKSFSEWHVGDSGRLGYLGWRAKRQWRKWFP